MHPLAAAIARAILGDAAPETPAEEQELPRQYVAQATPDRVLPKGQSADAHLNTYVPSFAENLASAESSDATQPTQQTEPE